MASLPEDILGDEFMRDIMQDVLWSEWCSELIKDNLEVSPDPEAVVLDLVIPVHIPRSRYRKSYVWILPNNCCSQSTST